MTEEIRWRSATDCASALSRSGLRWAVCNGIDPSQRLVGRDVDLWVEHAGVSQAREVIVRSLRRNGWTSVWHRRINLVDQVIGFNLDEGGVVTIGFDVISDVDWWTVAGLHVDPAKIVDYETYPPFVFSPTLRNFKTVVMPLLAGDHSRFLNGSRRVDLRTLECLTKAGILTASELQSWFLRHRDTLESPSNLSSNKLAFAVKDLKGVAIGSVDRKAMARSYLRKGASYAMGSLLYSPLSLEARDWSIEETNQALEMTRGTFVDLSTEADLPSRLIPRRPVSGISVHVRSSDTSKGLRVASDSWGLLWRGRLRNKAPTSWTSAGARGVMRALQEAYDAVCEASPSAPHSESEK